MSRRKTHPVFSSSTGPGSLRTADQVDRGEARQPGHTRHGVYHGVHQQTDNTMPLPWPGPIAISMARTAQAKTIQAGPDVREKGGWVVRHTRLLLGIGQYGRSTMPQTWPFVCEREWSWPSIWAWDRLPFSILKAMVCAVDSHFHHQARYLSGWQSGRVIHRRQHLRDKTHSHTPTTHDASTWDLAKAQSLHSHSRHHRPKRQPCCRSHGHWLCLKASVTERWADNPSTSLDSLLTRATLVARDKSTANLARCSAVVPQIIVW